MKVYNNDDRILFDSRDLDYKSPFGCLPKGETLSITIKIKSDLDISNLYIRFFQEGYEVMRYQFDTSLNCGDFTSYSCTIDCIDIGLYSYDFEIISHNQSLVVNKDYHNNPFIVTDNHFGSKWQLTSYSQKYKRDNSFAGRIMYQIFPDRFCKMGSPDLTNKLQPYWVHSDFTETPVYLPDEHGEVLNNDFYGGNIAGIISKLDYLKSLGVGVIYLNPLCFAYSNHRYDTSNYKMIDPMLGTLDDFRNLVNQAHNRDIMIILDCVFSHTGSRSIYFDINNEFGGGAYHNRMSNFYNWYQFNENGGYDCWWGIKTLPNVNELDNDYLDYLLFDDDSVIAFWLSAGIDGIRLDVADELPDEFLTLLYNRVKSINKDALIIGEVWEDASNKVSYSVTRRYFLGEELESVMNYVFKDSIIAFVKGYITTYDLNERIHTIVENYPKEVIHNVMNILSTHDTMRIITNLFGKDPTLLTKHEQATEFIPKEQLTEHMDHLAIAVFLQFMLPGMPCIYYGDEIGMQGYGDPFNRRFFDEANVNTSVYNIYKTLANVRQLFVAIQIGSYIPYYVDDDIFSFTRELGDTRLLCIVNLSDHEILFNCNPVAQVFARGVVMKQDDLLLNRFSCGVFIIK